jgi:hypothetical protein
MVALPVSGAVLLPAGLFHALLFLGAWL